MNWRFWRPIKDLIFRIRRLDDLQEIIDKKITEIWFLKKLFSNLQKFYIKIFIFDFWFKSKLCHLFLSNKTRPIVSSDVMCPTRHGDVTIKFSWIERFIFKESKKLSIANFNFKTLLELLQKLVTWYNSQSRDITVSHVI